MNYYGTLKLLDSSPTGGFAEPLTLAETKHALGIPERSPADTAEDDYLEMLISAAREEAETQQGRDLVRKYYQLSLDAFLTHEIELRAPLVSVQSVIYRDSTGAYTSLVADTDYIVDTVKQPGLVLPAYGESWPSFTAWPSSAVTISFTSGYLDTDAFWLDAGKRIKQGMLLLISEWWNNRLPLSYDISAGGSAVVDRITGMLRSGSLLRVR